MAAGTQEFLIENLTREYEGRRACLGIAAIVTKNIREDIFIQPIFLLLLVVLHVAVEVVACLSLFIWAHEIILVLNLKSYTSSR